MSIFKNLEEDVENIRVSFLYLIKQYYGSFGPYPVPWRASSVFPPRQQDRLRTSPPPRRTGGSRSAPSDCDRQRRSVPRGGFLGGLAVSELGRSACRVVSWRAWPDPRVHVPCTCTCLRRGLWPGRATGSVPSGAVQPMARVLERKLGGC
jgi:hypothetical protein